ncbi:MAG: cation transporter [Mobilitalea sp.]
MTTKQYLLEGLCCGNCASKIQKNVLAIEGVKNANINMDTLVLFVETENDTNNITEEITAIAISNDEDIVVKEL